MFFSVEDGSRGVSFALPTDDNFGHNATVQYLERRPIAGGGDRTPAWFAHYLIENAEKYMTSPTSFWPIWGDDHASLFHDVGGNATTIDQVISRLDARNITTYHPFLGIENGQAGFGHTALYIMDPSGWQVEYHASFVALAAGLDVDVGDFDQYCFAHCNAAAPSA